MINLIKLFSTNALSSYFYREKKRIPIFPLIILIVLSVVQMNFVTPDKHSNATIIGLLIVGLFTLYTLFGLLSTRLPSKMEDVVWIYTTPISIFKIGVAVALWQTFIRSILWISSSLLAILFIYFSEGYVADLLFTCICGVILFFLLEFWLVALSCARFHPILKVCSIIGFILFLGFSSVSVYRFLTNKSDSIILSLSKQFGLFFNGQPSVGSILLLLSIFLIAIFLMYVSTKNSKFKESIIREADFWSEFGDYQSMFNRIHHITEKPSWWGASFLTGTHALIWFEWAIFRKDKYVHITQSVVMVVLLWGAARWSSIALSIALVLLIIGHILNGFFSGVVKHALTGDLFLLPGSLVKKIIYLEALNIVPILGVEVLGVLFGSIYYEYPFWKGLIFVVLVLLALIGLRIFLFTQTYTEKTNLSIQVYFRNAFVIVAVVGMNVVSFFLLSTDLEFTIIPIIFLGILLGSISFLTFQRYYLMKYLFGLSLIFCILAYSLKYLLP